VGSRLLPFVSIAFLSCLIACSAQRTPEPDRPTRATVAPPASSPLAKVEVGVTRSSPSTSGGTAGAERTSIAGSDGLSSQAAVGSA